MRQYTLFIAFWLTLVLASAHSFMTEPDAYNRKFQLRDCKGKECKQACPSFPKDRKKMANTQEHPARVWRRGQKVTLRWAKNNHGNGFVRFSIVPVNVMMSRRWHTRLAFYTGCFTTGAFKCKRERFCGADNSGYGFHKDIRVPTIYPDGDYVVGMVWYGGARAPINKRPKFSDYYSCSFVKIKGGPLGPPVRPFFDPGDFKENIKEGGCLAAIDRPGVCSKHGCHGHARYRRPRGFKPIGKRPPRVKVRHVIKARRS